MYKPTRLKDIANELGVSITTVSRALADSYQISEKVRKEVAAVAVQMNYKRNPVAVQLRERKSYAIGVVISKVDNVFFSLIVDGIESVAYERGYHVIITQSHESYEREVLNVKHLMSKCVDGLLMSIAAESYDFKHIEEFQNKGSKIVFFDRASDNIDTHKVLSNNYQGAFDATTYLLNKGCKRIAFFGDIEFHEVMQQRRLGYEAAIRSNKITVDHDYIKYCGYGINKNRVIDRLMADLMNSATKPDAIFTASEGASQMCLQYLEKHGIRNQIDVVGFSNSELAKLYHPPFSCVKQKAFEMGRIATENLIDLIESKAPVEKFNTVVLNTELEINH